MHRQKCTETVNIRRQNFFVIFRAQRVGMLTLIFERIQTEVTANKLKMDNSVPTSK